MHRIFILREEKNAKALYAFLKANWRRLADEGHPMVLEVRKRGIQRSSAQNRRYWKTIHEIADQAWVDGRQFSPEIWHEAAKREFLPLVDLPLGGTVTTSTTALKDTEFTEYMQKVDAWATGTLGVIFEEAYD